MLRFRRMRRLQKFASVHASNYNLFNAERSLASQASFKKKPRCRSRRVARALRDKKGSHNFVAETGSHTSDSIRKRTLDLNLHLAAGHLAVERDKCIMVTVLELS